MNYLIDVNVWVALALIGHVHHAVAREWFGQLESDRLVFCRVTQKGLLRLLTNRRVMEDNVLSAAGAWRVYDSLCADERVQYAIEPPRLEGHWRELTRQRGAGPNFWTDAYLTAFAQAGDYTVVTFDRGLARHRRTQVRLLDPKADLNAAEV